MPDGQGLWWLATLYHLIVSWLVHQSYWTKCVANNRLQYVAMSPLTTRSRLHQCKCELAREFCSFHSWFGLVLISNLQHVSCSHPWALPGCNCLKATICTWSWWEQPGLGAPLSVSLESIMCNYMAISGSVSGTRGFTVNTWLMWRQWTGVLSCRITAHFAWYKPSMQ